MRSLILSLLLSTAPAALWAEVTELPARIVAATVYPQGAQVLRAVSVPGAEGARQILVPDLPAGTALSDLRIEGAGVAITAASLIEGRLPASEGVVSPAIVAARAEVDRLEAALALKEDALAAILSRAEAAQARIAFLRAVGLDASAADQLSALGEAVEAGVLVASQTSLAAEAEARAADLALRADREAVEKARQALAALEHPDDSGNALLLWVEGAGEIGITTFVSEAGWSPSYDLRYDADAEALHLRPYFNLYQQSGEDWTGVKLTISAARPSERAAPSELWPRPLRIMPEPPPVVMAAPKMARGMAESYDVEMMAEPAIAASGMPELQLIGELPTYVIDAPRDLRDGVEGLRVEWRETVVPAHRLAEAVPMLDETAYELVEGEAWSGGLMLPGPALIWKEGAVVAATDLPLMTDGAPFRIGTGPIDALRLKRREPGTMEGDTGVLSKSNTRRELVEIEVINDTGLDWPLRVIDRLPYSEQEDLRIETRLTPAASETDRDGQRGIVAWEFDLPAGQSKLLRSETNITWPIDQILR